MIALQAVGPQLRKLGEQIQAANASLRGVHLEPPKQPLALGAMLLCFAQGKTLEHCTHPVVQVRLMVAL